MGRLFVFNPDCELAIADGGRFYMPPANIVTMASELAFLPAYMGKEGDGVLVDRMVNDSFNRDLEISCKCVLKEDVFKLESGWMGEPWGRSPRMCRWLAEHGLGEDWQSAWKEWYSRKTAMRGLMWLAEQMSGIEEGIIPTVCHTMEEVKSTLDGCRMVKAPWSSSGKGLLRIQPPWDPKAEEWMGGVLKRQGYLMSEKFLDKVQDFAMEFDKAEKGTEFIGWSLFSTGERGEYRGNYVGSRDASEIRLMDLLGRHVLEELIDKVPRMLDELLPDYRGFLGVDMMVYRNRQGEMKIQPCVEINLRCNMGIVALFLSERYIHKHSIGNFAIKFHSKKGEALQEHLRLHASYPPVFRNNRLCSGYLNLTPIDETTRFVASVCCREG